jgi:hypothetical protein
MTGKFVEHESLTPKQARAWARINVAALLQIALDEDHLWLHNGPEGFSLDDKSRARMISVVQAFIDKTRT